MGNIFFNHYLLGITLKVIDLISVESIVSHMPLMVIKQIRISDNRLVRH